MTLAGTLAGQAVEVAPRLLGALFRVRSEDGEVAVRITETEAYAGAGDPGSHASRGMTPRTATMFGPPGTLYVYFSYGMHWCTNVVCAPDGVASAVLLRGAEVIAGHELARSRRAAARTDRDLARGPARLSQALGLGRSDDALALTAGGRAELELTGRPVPASKIRTGPRVGVSGPGGEGDRFPWRFWLDGEPTVSVYRPAVTRRRR